MKLKILDLDVEVTPRRQSKNLRLRVTPPNGVVKVSCPNRTPLKRVEQFVLDNIDWIQKNRAKLKNSTQATSYLNGGENLILFGKSYKVVEYESSRFNLTLDNDIAMLGVPKLANQDDRVEFVKKYLRKVAEHTFPPLVQKYEHIIGVKSSGIGYRYMTSRWGSCNVKTRHINFSVYACQKPMEYVEYLVCHELMHLIYPNHGNEFKNAIRQIIPNADIVAKLK